MTALATAPERGGGSTQGPGPLPVSSQFTRFLQRRDLSVLDVVRGAAPDSRRLFLGHLGTESVTHVVATSYGPAATSSVDNEHRVLLHARGVLGPVAQRSLPQVLERVDVYTTLDGLALTAVPDLGGSPRQVPRATARHLIGAIPDWFARVWSDSADGVAPVDVGATAMDEIDGILAHRDRSRDPGPTLETLRRARERLAEFDVPRTLTHGCLCPRHVVMHGGALGIEDWGLGRLAGDPLRDLGRFAVTVLDTRLAEVLAGRTSFASTIRQFIAESMRATPVPPRLWREVLVLSQLELAIEAQQRSDPHGMVRLGRAVRALQGSNRTR